MVFIISIIVSIFTAFSGSLLGLGGGMLFVPLMLFVGAHIAGFEWATPQAIVGISLLSMVFTTLSSSLANHRKGLIDYRLGFYYILGSIPGGIFGSYLSIFISGDEFPLYFGSLLLLISLLFFIQSSPERNYSEKGLERRVIVNGIEHVYWIRLLWPIIISFCIGMTSGLFGIGGGSMIVPTMILLFGVPAHIAMATSLFTIIFTSAVGSGTHIFLGHIHWLYALTILPGAFLGGWLGAKVNQVLQGKTLIRILQIFLILIGLYLIIDALT